MEGHCSCGAVRYRLLDRPLFTHACHCTWCHRESGSAFAIHAVIETELIELTAGPGQETRLPTPSGLGQVVIRCPGCNVALWCHYDGTRDLAYLKTGTLSRPQDCPPEAHIYVASKPDWLVLGGSIPALPGYYDWRVQWPAASVARRQAMLAR